MATACKAENKRKLTKKIKKVTLKLQKKYLSKEQEMWVDQKTGC